MEDVQVSVFIVNHPGEVARIVSHMAQFNVSIKAIMIADSMDYGIIRLVVDDPDKACAVLREMGYGFIVTEVITVDVADKPGGLSEVTEKLANADINLRYIYGTVTPGGGVAMAVISTDDNDRALEIISS